LGALGWGGLGLRRDRVRCGVTYGAVAFGIVLAVLLIVAPEPVMSQELKSGRVHVGVVTMLFEVLVAITLGTVVLEEARQVTLQSHGLACPLCHISGAGQLRLPPIGFGLLTSALHYVSSESRFGRRGR